MENKFARAILREAQVVIDDMNILFGMHSEYATEISEIVARMRHVTGLIQMLIKKIEEKKC